ncbi:hypothetical protein OF117_03095 [Geodermatophilus sp. YIM 151500]|uniref:hypothetical protein n=1 Tax=Geodermatophilus sp. YIM 151500 TaxID=2984531 RepID=UPI0021E388BC|nr:hypothetical protein [Geodermatophilus sp. YIM 151500]MCV2488337.1 hypothetical protein [Geodermatophilus sp. YIM 151500]
MPTAPASRRTTVLVVAACAAGAVLAFLLLDPVLAAALTIGGTTLALVALLARDWDRHPDFEQRELARARRRAVKRERTTEARARDRARWEAYQAKKAGRRPG